MKSLKIVGLTSVLILVCVSVVVLARQVQSEEPSQASEDPARQSVRSLDNIEINIDLSQIHQIVHDALEQARGAVEQARVGEEVHQALRDANIHGIVRDALESADIDSILRESRETTREALRAANVQIEIQQALRDADIDRTISEAMKELHRALADIRIEVH
ncbi:MAG: hypothetical protein P8020_06775 [Acidobacteriota bacterium]|jgi:hypothetical protein